MASPEDIRELKKEISGLEEHTGFLDSYLADLILKGDTGPAYTQAYETLLEVAEDCEKKKSQLSKYETEPSSILFPVTIAQISAPQPPPYTNIKDYENYDNYQNCEKNDDSSGSYETELCPQAIQITFPPVPKNLVKPTIDFSLLPEDQIKDNRIQDDAFQAWIDCDNDEPDSHETVYNNGIGTSVNSYSGKNLYEELLEAQKKIDAEEKAKNEKLSEEILKFHQDEENKRKKGINPETGCIHSPEILANVEAAKDWHDNFCLVKFYPPIEVI